MKATGIVRYVDDLDRVVIPKKIRRTLKIHKGGLLPEAFTGSDGYLWAVERSKIRLGYQQSGIHI